MSADDSSKRGDAAIEPELTEPEAIEPAPPATESLEAEGGIDVAEQSLARPAAVMAVGTALSRLTGLGRIAAMAYALGVTESRVADSYNLANTLPNVIYELVLGGVLSSVFIPVLVQELRTKDMREAWRSVSSLVTAAMMVLIGLTLVTMLIAPQIIDVFTSRVGGSQGAEQQELASFLLRVFALQIALYGFVGIAGGLLNSHGRFAVPMFAPIVNNLFVIASFIVFAQIVSGTPQLETVNADATQKWVLALGATGGVAAMALVFGAVHPPVARPDQAARGSAQPGGAQACAAGELDRRLRGHERARLRRLVLPRQPAAGRDHRLRDGLRLLPVADRPGGGADRDGPDAEAVGASRRPLGLRVQGRAGARHPRHVAADAAGDRALSGARRPVDRVVAAARDRRRQKCAPGRLDAAVLLDRPAAVRSLPTVHARLLRPSERPPAGLHQRRRERRFDRARLRPVPVDGRAWPGARAHARLCRRLGSGRVRAAARAGSVRSAPYSGRVRQGGDRGGRDGGCDLAGDRGPRWGDGQRRRARLCPAGAWKHRRHRRLRRVREAAAGRGHGGLQPPDPGPLPPQ